jgi:hypothetical protein
VGGQRFDGEVGLVPGHDLLGVVGEPDIHLTGKPADGRGRRSGLRSRALAEEIADRINAANQPGG